MLSRIKNNCKLFPAIIMLWWGTVFSLFAAKPQVVDIKPYADGFVMASADGMVVWTDIEGNSLDSVKLKTDIVGIEVIGSQVLTVSKECIIMRVERNGKSRRLCRRQITGSSDRVAGIACSGDKTFVLTRNGMILSTVDFSTFSLQLDFNLTYSGYYEQTRFCAICASGNGIFIAGTYYNGMPAVFTSAAGNVWSERSLDYTERGETLSLEQQPLSMAYDSRMDRFVLGCTDGYLFYMPGCSHCNIYESKAMQDIHAVAFNAGVCMFR